MANTLSELAAEIERKADDAYWQTEMDGLTSHQRDRILAICVTYREAAAMLRQYIADHGEG